MDDLYAAADVVVCRAGAMTVAELAVAGVPAVWCRCPGRRATTRAPTPGRWSRPGRPCWCPTPSATADRLAAVLDELLADPTAWRRWDRPPAALGRPDAADRVADVVAAVAVNRGR